MLYEREDGKVSCEEHARFVPMSDADEASWRQYLERDPEYGPDADPCEDCHAELETTARIFEREWGH